MNRQPLILISLIVLLLLFNFVVWKPTLGNNEVLRVSFLDVGQGDAIFIETPNKTQFIIDAGFNTSVLRKLGKEMSFYDRSIDAVLFTHPDADHIGGFPEIFDRYEIEYVFETGSKSDTKLYQALEERVNSEGSERVTLRRGQIIHLDHGVALEILFPDRELSGGDSNLSSAIARLLYGNTSFLLTGDAPSQTEEYITWLDGGELKSDVLKVSHHGSKTSTSKMFISAVRPQYSVISAGCDNRYGHPHTEVLEALEEVRTQILSTCTEGTITFESNGRELKLK